MNCRKEPSLSTATLVHQATSEVNCIHELSEGAGVPGTVGDELHPSVVLINADTAGHGLHPFLIRLEANRYGVHLTLIRLGCSAGHGPLAIGLDFL